VPEVRSLARLRERSYLMAKRIDPIIQEVLARYEVDPRRALWDCHGTWVIYHKYVELIGAKAGVKLDKPDVIHADPSPKGKTVVICVTGNLGDRSEWAFGEAAPYNNKNAYPFAMAEKRAKDRVILKLVGLAGHVYTDIDAAEITSDSNGNRSIKWENDVPDDDGGSTSDVKAAMAGASSLDELNEVAKSIQKMNLPSGAKVELRRIYSDRKKELEQ